MSNFKAIFMKKNLTHLFAVLCMVSFFTACSKDDDASSGDWKDISKAYDNTKTLVLKMDEATIPVNGKSVTIEASSAEKASVTLTNVLPESKAVVISADMKAMDGTFALSGEATVGECVVSINGTVKEGVATVVYTRKLSSAVVGNWKLKAGTDAIYLNIITGNAMIDGLVQKAAPAVSGLIWSKVSDVAVYLPENGVFGVSWRKQGESTDMDLSAVMSMFSIQYCVVDDKFMLALDKNYIDIVVGLAGAQLQEMGIPMEEIMSLLVDLGGYYGLPLNMRQNGKDAIMYVDKGTVIPVLTIAAPMIKPMLPEEYRMLVDLALGLLPNAQALDLGLVLTK